MRLDCDKHHLRLLIILILLQVKTHPAKMTYRFHNTSSLLLYTSDFEIQFQIVIAEESTDLYLFY